MELEAIMAQRKRHTGQFKDRVAGEAIACKLNQIVDVL